MLPKYLCNWRSKRNRCSGRFVLTINDFVYPLSLPWHSYGAGTEIDVIFHILITFQTILNNSSPLQRPRSICHVTGKETIHKCTTMRYILQKGQRQGVVSQGSRWSVCYNMLVYMRHYPYPTFTELARYVNTLKKIAYKRKRTSD